MKILFEEFRLPYLLRDSDYPVGGWAIELRAWIDGLARHGVQTAVLALQGAASIAGGAEQVNLLETYDPSSGVRWVRYLTHRIPAFTRAVCAYRPDVVVGACSSLHVGILAYAAKRCGATFVYRVANDTDVDQRLRKRLRLYQRLGFGYGLRRSSAILCQNRYQYAMLRRRFRYKPLCVLHNPFLPEEPGVDVLPRRERGYVAWLAVFSAQKNMGLLADVAARMPQVPFRVAGMPGKTLDAETRQAMERLRRLGNVQLVGYVKRRELTEFLRRAIVLLSTSHHEGFSNTFLEAFHAGTPVVAPRHVDPDSIVTGHRLGRTVGGRDPARLAEAVAEIVAMPPDTYAQLSRHCRDYVISRHDTARIAAEMLSFLKARPSQGMRA